MKYVWMGKCFTKPTRHCILRLPKAIISDRDRKFLSELWSAMFKKLGVKLLYSTAYYPQIDGRSEQSNQTLEIALCFQISHDTSYRQVNWPGILLKIQRGLNNSWSVTTNKTPNETALGFTPTTELDLLKLLTNQANRAKTRLDVADSIAFAQMNSKFHYNRKHQPMILIVGDYICFMMFDVVSFV